jgi:hypothetical protein
LRVLPEFAELRDHIWSIVRAELERVK